MDGSDEKKDFNACKLLCNGCLCIGRTLHKITDEKLAQFYLNALKEIPSETSSVPSTCPTMCWECKASLKKAATFKEQMQDSHRILQAYTNESLRECLLSDIVRSSRLRPQLNSFVSIDPEPQTELHICRPSCDRLDAQQCDFFKEEPKNESPKPELDDDPMDDDGPSDIDNVRCSNSGMDRKMSSKPKYPDVEFAQVPTEEPLFNDIKTRSASYYSNHNSLGKQKPVFHQVEITCDMDSNEVSSREFDDEPIDADGQSDIDNPQALKSKVCTKKKKKKKKNKLESKVKRRTDKVVKRLQHGAKSTKKAQNDQKILTIELTYEELLLEREKEVQKQSYKAAEFKCESCIVGFNYSKSYKAHVTTKHAPGLGNYICPICKTVISSVDSFTAHYKRHLRRYECSICKKRTMDIKVMQQHYYSTHEISLKEYKCELCGKISNSVDAHRYHKDTHKARVECPECDKTFTHRAGLLNHRLSVHELSNKFPCTLCEKVFRWKNSLKRHLEKHMDKTSSGAACCDDCGVTFQSISSYQRHLKNSLKHVRQEELKFICDHCSRHFADKTKIRDHIEEKHLHKTYSCHICLKQSKNRVSLDQHIRNVHKGRPNNKICHHCGKAFPTKVQLESHIRTHTGERPFICEFCPTTFSQQSNLYKHNRQVHLNIKSKRSTMCKKRKEEKPTEGTIDTPHIDPYRPVAILQYSPSGICTNIQY